MAFTAIERLRCRYDCAQHPPAPLPGRSRRSLADRLRVQLGAVVKLPNYTPIKAIPTGVPADAPVQIRHLIADWLYQVAYWKNAWNDAAKKAWVAIMKLPIKLEGPKGWGDFGGLIQPGWIDLCERAEIAIRQAGVSEEIIAGWSVQVDRWIAEWNQEYNEPDNVSGRLAIYASWQKQYVDEKIEEYQEAVDQFIDDHGVGIGAGVVVGGAAMVAVGLALAFPDEARKAAQAGYKGAKRLVKK